MGVKLFLIRHGQTVWNLEGRYQGAKDTALTDVGLKQAELASKYLSKVNFSFVYSCPLIRALDTANIIALNKDTCVVVRENLKEINFGKWEGMKFEEINAKYKDDYRGWLEDPFQNPPTGGESFECFTERTLKEINYMIGASDNGASIAVVTHGGVIVSLLIYWLKIPVLRWRSIIQRQGAINIVVVDNGFPYISQINYTGHLNPVYDNNEDKVIEIYSSLKDDC